MGEQNQRQTEKRTEGVFLYDALMKDTYVLEESQEPAFAKQYRRAAAIVCDAVYKAVKEAKAGKVEYRVDKQSIVHLSIGKVSFGAKKLEENANAFFESLRSQKPSSLKGAYINSIAICTTMGPSIKVENLNN